MSSRTPIHVSIDDASLKTNTKETFFGILIDSELSFDRHVSSICSKASKNFHALGCIATFISFKKCRTLMKPFIEFQFNYCPLIWIFHSRVILIRSPLLTNYLQKTDNFLLTTGTLKVKLLIFTSFFTVFLQIS